MPTLVLFYSKDIIDKILFVLNVLIYDSNTPVTPTICVKIVHDLGILAIMDKRELNPERILDDHTSSCMVRHKPYTY